MRYLAADYETSGLDASRHAPVTFGLAVMEDGEALRSQEWTFSPPMKDGKITREYDVCALKISGTTWKQIEAGKPISTVMGEVADFVGDDRSLMVAAFNAPFDFQWFSTCLFLGGSWNQHLRRFETFKPPLIGAWQCVRLMAVHALDLERYDLDTVSAHFGLSRSGEGHGALEDAILAGQIYARLLAGMAGAK